MNLSVFKFRKNKKLKFLSEAIVFLVGVVIFAAGTGLFITPGRIAVGGFTGISIIINYFTKFPVGTIIIILNIPMFIICAKIFGIKFILKTIAGVVLSSVLIDIFSAFRPFKNELSFELCALFGGVMQGIGLGLVYLNGYTTGGTDLVIWLLKLKFPNVTTGFLLFILDSIVVTVAAIVERDAQAVLYSAIAIFSYTKVLDTILGATDRANLAFIISGRYKDLADRIMQTLDRGVTVIDSRGWFTKESKTMIMCVIDRSQIYTLRSIINEYDPSAFFILADAREVIGLGFKDIVPNNNKKK
ncbi:MAG: YitT family protein [Oscillospiraceae bacterium]|nr:YitT family protein [Oscillospiraceae bacterium]